MGQRREVEGRWLEDSGGETARLGEGVGALGPAAEAVVLIPSWQVEKCEGLCAEEAARHYEVLCVPSVRRRLIRVRGVLP